MKKNVLYLFSAATFMSLFGGIEQANAQNGQPHSLSAYVTYTNVLLKWKAPAEKISLQWHDNEDYNGKDGLLKNPEGFVTFYAASKFSSNDLRNYVGEKIESIAYFEYRPLYKVSVLIYENGRVVAEKEANLDGFKKNSWRVVNLDEPYTIKEGKDVMIAVKYSAGRNMDMVAICDRAPHKGKGNLYSYDGKNWNMDGPGDFLITAYLKNDATDVPEGYNIYRDDKKVNGELLKDVTGYELDDETEGKHSYAVSAQYPSGEKKSYVVEKVLHSAYNSLPPVACVNSSVDNLSCKLSWVAPLKRGSEMTWSNKSLGLSIGGTSSKNPVVWIKQEFSAEDMAAFPNHQITAINSFVGEEGGITGVTAFVMKNGVIDYSEALSSDVVAAIKTNGWNKFTLATPYKMEVGNTYAFGLYYTHEVSKHPVGVDTGIAVNGKGNSFSTSSVSSKGFDKTKPTWKMLSSGNIAGNIMLTADVEALNEEAGKSQEISDYDLYRDGVAIAKGIKSTEYTDNVSDLGLYTYTVVAKDAEGRASEGTDIYVTYALPAEYSAPIVLEKEQDGKDISFAWSSSAYQMQHYGTPAIQTGFAEDLSMLYGAKFSKEELTPYVGYDFYSLKFGIGAKIGEFKMEIRTSDNEVLYSKQYSDGDVEPGYIYQVTFDKNERFAIPADKDLYLVYNATLPGGSKPIYLDAGPAVDNGAVVSLTTGSTWMKLSTIASELKDYNLVIGGLAVASAGENGSKVVKLDNGVAETAKVDSESLRQYEIGKFDIEKIEVEAVFGVETDNKNVRKVDVSNKPKAKSYRIYKNGEMIKETASSSYSETLDERGTFNYYVTTVYENGWESAASAEMTFKNTIVQRPQGPYALSGESSGTNLKLTWQSAGSAPELTYQTGNEDLAIGMTGGSTREGYQAIKYAASEMKDKVGHEVSHVKFKLADNNLTSASVFVMYTDNIIYEQEVPLNEVKKGWNDVALNNPVPVVAGQDISIGYHITYETGLKPMICDNAEAVSGYGDLISSSAAPGYWYSLAKKFKVNHNWRISAVLKAPDSGVNSVAAREDVANVTYNVYCDGRIVASGITDMEYVVANAENGKYTVTASNNGEESGESNAVTYEGAVSEIASVVNESGLSDMNVYGIDGQLIGKAGDMRILKCGVYIVNGKKVVK